MASIRQGIERTDELINYLVNMRDDLIATERLEPLLDDVDRGTILSDIQGRLTKIRDFLAPVDMRTLTRTPANQRPKTDVT